MFRTSKRLLYRGGYLIFCLRADCYGLCFDSGFVKFIMTFVFWFYFHCLSFSYTVGLSLGWFLRGDLNFRSHCPEISPLKHNPPYLEWLSHPSVYCFAALRFMYYILHSPSPYSMFVASPGLYLILCLFQTNVFQSFPMGSDGTPESIALLNLCLTKSSRDFIQEKAEIRAQRMRKKRKEGGGARWG